MKKDYLENLEMYGITARIRRLNDKINSSGRKVYKLLDIDIDSNWHLILLLLEEKGKLSVTEIANILSFSHPAVIKIAKKMIEKEYLISSRDITDNRKQLLSLSKKAIQKLPGLKKKWEIITQVHSEYITADFIQELSLLEESLNEKSMEQRIIETQIKMENKINISSLIIEQLNPTLYNEAIQFLKNIFNKEQNIPQELIPLKNKNQKWWCIRNTNKIIGIVAAWKVNTEWHVGRLAIDEKLRGLGLGTKLMIKTVDELFQTGIKTIIVDARDIAVKIVLKLGGKVTGKRDFFYGNPITPMVIYKDDFIREVQNKINHKNTSA